jgi:hypothetical protein
MLGIYLFAAILGTGLLAFSLLAGGDGGADHHGPLFADAEHPGFGELLLGFFRPRNFVFGLAGFGLTGTVLTLLDAGPALTLLCATIFGVGFFLTSHGLFTLLRRSESATEALSDTQLMGERARVTVPLEPGKAGRVACLLGGREVYLTARLAPGAIAPVAAGREVVVVRVAEGTAEVLPPDLYERQLPA